MGSLDEQAAYVGADLLALSQRVPIHVSKDRSPKTGVESLPSS